ncbi:MAG: hypothetical protein JNL58_03090 [Planctomyces sp.]|nr:hypothetical protein [Planctomyces sp.]
MTPVRSQSIHRLNRTPQLLPRPLVVSDLEAFGPDAAVALAELHPQIADLNRIYRMQVQSRSLISGKLLDEWNGRRVRVFLRHDSVFVFAIASDNEVGMANLVELNKVRFVVDATGRSQTLSLRGPLANSTTVHAWLEGTLVSSSEHTTDASLLPNLANEIQKQGFVPITYRPALFESFVTCDSHQPVVTVDSAKLIPGKQKVWARGLTQMHYSADGSRIR